MSTCNQLLATFISSLQQIGKPLVSTFNPTTREHTQPNGLRHRALSAQTMATPAPRRELGSSVFTKSPPVTRLLLPGWRCGGGGGGGVGALKY